ncbi:MAG: phenylacetate--CoA ligase family protein [Dehalococcoidia bacterium]
MLAGVHRLAARAGFHLRYGRSLLVRRWRELEESQWWPPEKVKELQWQKLQRLSQHAYEHVPFYRQWMKDAGVHPEGIRTPEDYSSLPIMTKADINEHLEEMVADGFPRSRLIKTASGGSTGAPVHLYHDRDFIACYRAAKLRNFKWAGWQPGDAWARIWGSAFDVAPHERLLQRLADRAVRARFLLAFDLSEEAMARFASTLQRFRPDLIEAYATAMYVFAAHVSSHGVRGIRPRGIICSAEMLLEHHRRAIEEAFGCRVFNRYGGREMGDVSQECEMGSMHINAESMYVEVVTNGRLASPGERGEIILTSLDLYSAPLLRYRVEDVGTLATGKCSCGRGLPMLSSIEGRVQGVIALPSGKYVSGVFFPHLFKDFDVVQYQVVQESLEEVNIRLVAGPGLTEEDKGFILRTIREYTRGELRVRFTLLDEIEAGPSGKFQYTVSNVPLNLARVESSTTTRPGGPRA